MLISTELIKELRERTGISLAQCKKALEDTAGDMEKALAVLHDAGTAIVEKKSTRTLAAGKVASYIHSTGNMGAMVEVHSETDFVAKNPEFRALADDMAMHIAAMQPVDTAELLEQPYVKDPSITVKDLVQNHVQKFGERIEIIRFVRFDTSSPA
ncbi:MAG: translation elongation factor Ts [Candidatus Vogelbacteria bacterium]|nr:translation elongation factor Ts [Candidatus Vogelbacteria bacterium]